MKVAVLQQHLRSLMESLKASGAAAKIVNDLEQTCQQLEPFKERDFADLADFLRRAAIYEQEGHWPAASAKKAKAARADPASLQEIADRLRAQVGASEIKVDEVEALTVPQLRNLMALLGITATFKRKAEALEQLRTFLRGSTSEAAAAEDVPPSGERLARIVETLKALKTKADLTCAPLDEIKSELHALAGQLDARDAIAAAKALGVTRNVSTRSEALEEIQRKVLDLEATKETILF